VTKHAASRTSLAILVFTLASVPCIAQTRVTSLEQLRRELATGDVITVVPTGGQAVKGRLVRLSPDELAVRPVKGSPDRTLRDVTVRFDAIQSLGRPRDPVRNGTIRGAAIGAGFAGALFIYALAVDRNEVDEWGPIYAGFAGVSTGIGALIGWTVDAAHSKPALTFDAAPGTHTHVSVHPIVARGRGIGLAVSFSR